MPAVRHEDIRDELLAGLGEEGRRHYEAFGAIYEARQLAGRLAELRVEADLTQRQAAKLAGVDQADLSRIESGQIMPSLPTLLRLLDAVGGALVVTSTRRSSTAPSTSSRRGSRGTTTHQPRKADPRRRAGSTPATGRRSA